MKLVYNYWLPDTDNHFERLITKRIKNGGPAEYQDDVRAEAYKYVANFDLAIDIGANIGFWSKPMSKKFKKIIAFEPIPQVYKCLEKNVDTNVEIKKFALGNINGFIEMTYDEYNTGNSFVSNINGDIEIKRLDDLHLPKFDLIKIDCERYELEILKGAKNTLLKYKPVIVCEQHKDTNFAAGNYLQQIGAKQICNVRKDYIFHWNI